MGGPRVRSAIVASRTESDNAQARRANFVGSASADGISRRTAALVYRRFRPLKRTLRDAERALYLSRQRLPHLVDAGRPLAEQSAHRGRLAVRQAAGDDEVEVLQVRLDVQRDAVQARPAADADA